MVLSYLAVSFLMYPSSRRMGRCGEKKLIVTQATYFARCRKQNLRHFKIEGYGIVCCWADVERAA
jgi:hypothetical protein